MLKLTSALSSTLFHSPFPDGTTETFGITAWDFKSEILKVLEKSGCQAYDADAVGPHALSVLPASMQILDIIKWERVHVLIRKKCSNTKITVGQTSGNTRYFGSGLTVISLKLYRRTQLLCYCSWEEYLHEKADRQPTLSLNKREMTNVPFCAR